MIPSIAKLINKNWSKSATYNSATVHFDYSKKKKIPHKTGWGRKVTPYFQEYQPTFRGMREGRAVGFLFRGQSTTTNQDEGR